MYVCINIKICNRFPLSKKVYLPEFILSNIISGIKTQALTLNFFFNFWFINGY